jgi:uncharacterized protein DUF998
MWSDQLGEMFVELQCSTRRGGSWAPILLGVAGAGTIVAGIFHPDPALGFRPGNGQNWSGGRDLNSRSPGPKPGAFPS